MVYRFLTVIKHFSHVFKGAWHGAQLSNCDARFPSSPKTKTFQKLGVSLRLVLAPSYPPSTCIIWVFCQTVKLWSPFFHFHNGVCCELTTKTGSSLTRRAKKTPDLHECETKGLKHKKVSSLELKTNCPPGSRVIPMPLLPPYASSLTYSKLTFLTVWQKSTRTPSLSISICNKGSPTEKSYIVYPFQIQDVVPSTILPKVSKLLLALSLLVSKPDR